MTNPLIAHQLPLTGKHLIEASAGTGKTYNITRIYLRLLLETPLKVQNLLVMTFTRAATAELKGRLNQALNAALETWGQPTQDPFFTHLYAQRPAAQAKARLREAVLHLDEAAIYTLHGFCKRALTDQAFVSGISFHADLEADTAALIEQAVEDWYRHCQQRPDFAELYALWPTPQAFCKAWGHQIASHEQISAPPLPDLTSTWLTFASAWQATEAEAFAKLNIQSRRNPETKQAMQQIAEQLTLWAALPWNPDWLPELSARLNTKDLVGSEKKRTQQPELAQLCDQLDRHQHALKAQWALAGIEFARQAVQHSKQQRDQLDFNDLIQTLRARLDDPQTGPDLAASLSRQFPAALVDEFQDTDPDQYAILEALYGKAQQNQQLLCMIGDPKQAIYGFRGGDVFAYLAARQSADAHWVMDTNYRSAAGVIQGYNRLFHSAPLDQPASSQVFGFDIAYHPVKAGKPQMGGLQDPQPRGDFHWCLLPPLADFPGINSQQNGYTQAGQSVLADWCAAEIQRLLNEARLDDRPLQPADIALLVRDRHEAARMQQSLRHYGLKAVYLSAQEGVFDSEEAQQLLIALRGILQPEKDRLLIAALATPWLGYDAEQLAAVQQDEQRWATAITQVSRLRQQWLKQGFMKMALTLCQTRLHPEPNRHDRCLTNAQHLITLLQQASQRHRQPEALIHWFEQTCEEAKNLKPSEHQQLRLESDGDLIRLVTLHGAKGLEYPVVFLPFISYGKDPSRQSSTLVRYHDRDDYQAHRVLAPQSEQLAWAQEEDAAEAIRLLYVGATRAERRLYLLAAAFSQFKRSPLAHCCKASDFDQLCQQIQQQVDEGCALLQMIDQRPTAPNTPPADASSPASALSAARFERGIETDWFLSSFSALTRNLRHGGISLPDRDSVSAPNPLDALDITPLPSRGLPALRFSLPRGTEAGNLLHDLLEQTQADSLDTQRITAQVSHRYLRLVRNLDRWPENLTQWLQEIYHTPLPSGTTLARLSAQDQLKETEFYFPMQGGTASALAQILQQHRQGSSVNLPVEGRLKGMMHGFIDLIYCHQGRYYLVDYKSTYLGETFADYHPDALEHNLRQNFYDLQALIYTLALHRYLRWRLPDYQPQQHLGGVEYLYLRGMHPEQTSGIYHRPVDHQALSALDALFAPTQAAAQGDH